MMLKFTKVDYGFMYDDEPEFVDVIVNTNNVEYICRNNSTILKAHNSEIFFKGSSIFVKQSLEEIQSMWQ